MNSQTLIVSPDSLTQRLFQFDERKRQISQHKKFVSEMITGILGSKSTLVSNVARFLDEDQSLNYTERRLCRMLSKAKIDWDEIRIRALELQCRMVNVDDVIAFDPGDLIKEYAWKMEGLYRVHDGSTGECGNGFEDFCVEAIQWKDGKKQQIPLYQKLSSAKREDYISQNYQIIEAIRIVHEYLGEDKGIWTFDRGHDRSRIFEKALLILKMRWILRAKENRAVIPEDPRFLKAGQYHPGLMDVAKQIELS